MDILSIVGVVATVAAAFVTFYGTYVSIKLSKEKKDPLNKTTFLFTGHSKFTHNDNSVNLNVDNKTINYYDYVPSQESGKKPTTEKQKIRSGLLEFVIETSKNIKQLKLIALGVSLAFTSIYILLTILDVHFIGTTHIDSILNIDDRTRIYVYVFISLFLLIYCSILLIVTAWYSKEFDYQARIRDFINIDDLSLFKQKLINRYKFKNFDEFPVRAIVRMIDNIRIWHKNDKAYRYNNRVVHKRKKEILPTKGIITDNLYFKTIAAVIIVNILYMFFYPPLNKSTSQSFASVFEPNPHIAQYDQFKPYVLKRKITRANIRSGKFKSDSNIIRTIGRNEIFYSYVQSGETWWLVKTQDGQLGYMHSATIRRY